MQMHEIDGVLYISVSLCLYPLSVSLYLCVYDNFRRPRPAQGHAHFRVNEAHKTLHAASIGKWTRYSKQLEPYRQTLLKQLTPMLKAGEAR